MIPCRNRLKSAAIFVVLLTWLSPAIAAAETWELRYVGLLNRLPLLTADLEVALAPEAGGIGAFHTTARLATDPDGLGALIPFVMQLESDGGRRGGIFGPVWHRSNQVAWQQEQRVDIDYQVDGSVSVFVDPPTRSTQAALDGGLAAGTIDPVTVGMALIDQITRSGACSGSMPVFDGIRRYDLAVVASAVEVPPARISAGGPAHGDAVMCRLSISYLSGFPANASQSGYYPHEITLWMAPLAGGGQVVPVMASTNLAVGPLRVELVSAVPK